VAVVVVAVVATATAFHLSMDITARRKKVEDAILLVNTFCTPAKGGKMVGGKRKAEG